MGLMIILGLILFYGCNLVCKLSPKAWISAQIETNTKVTKPPLFLFYLECILPCLILKIFYFSNIKNIRNTS